MPRQGRPNSQLLTILEGKWFPRIDFSVRELFVPLFTVWAPDGLAAYHYEMFTNEAAFRDAIAHAFRSGAARTVYIAAHGSRKSIQGFHDAGISRVEIRNALKRVGPSEVRRGVYFGSCEFASRENAEFILASCDRVEWMAGYTTHIDWIDTGVLDLFFLRHFLFPKPGRGHKRPRTTLQRLRYATERICDYMPELARQTQFHVYVRGRSRRFMVRDLVDEIVGVPIG
jgi:hypothetical protein